LFEAVGASASARRDAGTCSADPNCIQKLLEKQMARHPVMIEDNKKPPKSKRQLESKSKADDQSHKPARHIEETARLASSVETAKDPATVRRAKD
jgi:hypothetical protein